MRKKIVLIACGMLLALAGCGEDNNTVGGVTLEPVPASEDTQVVEEAPAQAQEETPAQESEDKTTPARQDGERFEDVIVLEGIEETVKYEHVRNEKLGFEIDYDYESFDRKTGDDSECFISIYDDASNPENYLEITYVAENSDAVVASVSEELSKDYDINKEDCELENAGKCTRIDASAASDGSGTPDQLQMVYIIPAGDGTILGTAHYGFEAAEGFGHRFHYIMDTLSLISG